jgi:hypothetical protein
MIMTELEKTGSLIFVLVLAKLVLLILYFMSFYMSYNCVIFTSFIKIGWIICSCLFLYLFLNTQDSSYLSFSTIRRDDEVLCPLSMHIKRMCLQLRLMFIEATEYEVCIFQQVLNLLLLVKNKIFLRNRSLS